ncbi:hypothetical protein CDCA_CDCA10G3034 [Cyanidium caldarium]|uniref:AB hydrolase-1 domain-containing protein n=1 Tax=Cyanidium caldarium TaxID=2771 RepID=A0AAV9IXJ5_CYACA|nr:hypothetical protein CDCA_CDCA10G3034 [Cyanidium caldarium]
MFISSGSYRPGPFRRRRRRRCHARAWRCVAKAPCLVLPGLGNSAADYVALLPQLPTGSRCLSVARYDWARNVPTLFTQSYWRGKLEPWQIMPWYLARLDRCLREMLAAPEAVDTAGTGSARVNLIGHSAGGWLARIYLAEFAADDVRRRVAALVTLGTPNVAPPPGVFDQTRGLLAYLARHHPLPCSAAHSVGAAATTAFAHTRLTCVGSRAVRGDLRSGKLEEAVAYTSYWPVCGRGRVAGDGIVPAKSAFLCGARAIVLADARHSPLTAKHNWYGSPQHFRQWADALP